jgi:hypothetical protein
MDVGLYTLQPTIAHLRRSLLHRRLQRHGIGRLLHVAGDMSAKMKYKAPPSATIVDATLRVTSTLPKFALSRESANC